MKLLGLPGLWWLGHGHDGCMVYEPGWPGLVRAWSWSSILIFSRLNLPLLFLVKRDIGLGFVVGGPDYFGRIQFELYPIENIPNRSPLVFELIY